MIRVIFFHDNNWKIKGYKVEWDKESRTGFRTQFDQLYGLLLGTQLALMEHKAFHLKTDDENVYEVVVLRQNKNTVAALKPLELGVKHLAVTDRDAVEVLQF